ncbi:hypothetical protein RI129_005195 [Pyrocoelia pectoralis]|uniref:NADH dehydrogenase [ubiquinone] 1 alpha subcomplex subunit 2 n=1 Tax=Pyrocoelia pectoralis TaxID=417401 RepID=A0AAN7ZS21_9COLE
MSRIVKFGNHIKEIRIHLCQTGATSKGVRDFIEKYYVDIKTRNPTSPILIRECSGVQPRIWARYEKGKESSVSVTSLEADEILSKFESLINKS